MEQRDAGMGEDPTSYRWWRDAPGMVRRCYRRMFLLLLLVEAVPAASLLLLLMHFRRTLVLPSLAAMTILMAALLGSWVFALGRWETRLVRRLRQAHCKLCAECGFDLTGHHGRVNCPECGVNSDVNGLRAAWRAFRPTISSEAL